MKARPEGEQYGQETENDSKMLKQSGLRSMATVKHQESKVRDAESSKGMRIQQLAHLGRSWKDCKALRWNGKAVQGQNSTESILRAGLSHPLISTHFNVLMCLLQFAYVLENTVTLCACIFIDINYCAGQSHSLFLNSSVSTLFKILPHCSGYIQSLFLIPLCFWSAGSTPPHCDLDSPDDGSLDCL